MAKAFKLSLRPNGACGMSIVFSRIACAFKRSRDPKFSEKVEDVVELYMNPPAHAVVVSIDEKTKYWLSTDSTQPGSPLRPDKCGTMTRDYKRNVTTTLFAALNILDETVIRQGQLRSRLD